MFNGIKLKTFLSTPEEWHALVIGFFEVLCPWPAQYKLIKSDLTPLIGEEHYYYAGRGLGFIALLFTLFGIAYLVKEVLL